MWERARAGAITKVVNDQFGRPTYTADLAQSIWGLTARGMRGLCHVANTGEASWFDVAKQVFHRANRLDLLSPCASKDYPTAARRPRHSVLGSEKSERDIGGRLRNWSEALDELLTLLER
jgi:dTDP-4-dehydrorhamnose reductase